MNNHMIFLFVQLLYILEILHRAHTGKDALLQNARAHYFWPHLTKEVEDITRSCLECLQSAPTQPDQPLNTILGKTPGEILGIDPFTIPHCNKVFLIIVDSFSSFFCLLPFFNCKNIKYRFWRYEQQTV